MRSQQANKAPKKYKHHFLVSGKVMFVIGDDTDKVATVEVNTMFHSEHSHVGLRQLQTAQQGLQLQVVQKTGEENIQFIDVVILNIVNLGYMTDEMFNNVTPEPVIEQAPEAIIPKALQ